MEKWSRPIFEQYRERRDNSEVNERELQLLQVHDSCRITQSARVNASSQPSILLILSQVPHT